MPVSEEALQGLALLFQERREVVTSLVWCGQREKGYRAPLGLVHLHCVQQLDAPTLRNLGRTHRASPNAAACLQTPIAGGVVSLGLPDLNIWRASSPKAKAFRGPGLGKNLTGSGLQGKPLNP